MIHSETPELSTAETTLEEIDRAVRLSETAFAAFRRVPKEQRAAFLDAIAKEIDDLGDALLECSNRETALPIPRLSVERARTTNQLRLFANLIREGSWCDARIDPAMPDRKPQPRPDLRRMLLPLGPVGVWSASNFPLAFSVAGGDTASAFAAGNPVIVKTHPAHPETSEMVAGAVARAVISSGMPAGVFSMIHGRTPETSLALVRHPLLKAGGFTGSLRAGRALFDAASSRPEPIPFFAEMGSVNPVFVLPSAMGQSGRTIAGGLANSVNMFVGQQCTCPGLILGMENPDFNSFADTLRSSFEQAPAGTMLYPGLRQIYADAIDKIRHTSGIQTTTSSHEDGNGTRATPTLFETAADVVLSRDELLEEVFGPSTILIGCKYTKEMEEIARRIPGSLTATVHGTPEDFAEHRGLIAILEDRAGRIIFNGYPTGVEVCPAMQHGGPYPATTDSRFTSVGTAAIQRFARPVCYQNFPQEVLPPELKDENPFGILRTIDGVLRRDAI